MADLQLYQSHFIDFLVTTGALSFGEFTLKSGRKAPYFINTGKFNSGETIGELGRYYAYHIASLDLPKIDVVFGPAYKGIPLAVTTAIALHEKHAIEVGYAFDRKEEKDHGDKGKIVGRVPVDGDNVILVEDVITAGTTLKQVIPFLNRLAKIKIAGVVISVDRCEKGSGEKSAVQEARDTLGVEIFPIVTIHQILQHLDSTLTPELRLRNKEYLEQFGA